jgi:hypothetical protein
VPKDGMIIEVSFGLAGGINFALEKSWKVVDGLIKKYPGATWRRIVDRKKKEGKYIVEL